MPGAAERERDLRDDAGLVRHGGGDLANPVPAAGEPDLEQRAALLRDAVLPRRERVAVAVQQRPHLPQPPHEVVDLRAERVAVGRVDLRPQRRVGTRDAGRVAEARPGRRQRLAAERLGRLRDEQVGDDVRKMRDDRHQPVVVVGRDRGRHGAEAGDEPRQALVEHAGRRLARGQVPRRAVEEVRAGVRHAGRLGAGERVAADEAVARDRPDERGLRRPDVADDRVRQRLAERADGVRQRVDGDAGDRDVGRADLGDAADRLVDRAALERDPQRLRAAVAADDVRPQPAAGGHPDRAADQADADERDAHPD